MNEKLKEQSLIFINQFSNCYKNEQINSLTCAVTTFIACYARMENSDRFISISSLLSMVKQIGVEQFEDGEDFVSFVKENPIQGLFDEKIDDPEQYT